MQILNIKVEIDKIVSETTDDNVPGKAKILFQLGEYIMSKLDLPIFSDADNIAHQLKSNIESIRLQYEDVRITINKNQEMLDRKEKTEEEYLKLVPIISEIELLIKKEKEIMIGYEAKVEEHNCLVTKIEQIKTGLEIIEQKHEDIMATFNAYYFNNERIYGALKTREGVQHYVEMLSKEIAERLLKYDNDIKAIVEKRSKLPICQLEETKKY